MSRFFLALAAVLSLSGISSASVWTNSITYDGLVDVVQDNSVSLALFDQAAGPGKGVVSAGDVIGGVIKWNTNIANATTIGAHTIAVFATEVLSNNGVGSNVIGGKPTVNFSLGAATSTLNSMLAGIATFQAGGAFSAGTVGVILSYAGGPDPTTQDLATTLANINANYKIDFEFGLITASDFFEAELRDQKLGAGETGVIRISDADGDGFADEYDNFVGVGPGSLLAGVAIIGQEAGAFSVIRDFTGPGAANYLPLPTEKLDGSSTGASHILLSPSTTLGQPSAAQALNGYAFTDQSIIALNAVPEPSSMAVFGVVALAGLGIRRFRRR